MSTKGSSTIVAPGWTRSVDGTLTRPLDVVENWLLGRIRRAASPPGCEAEGVTYKLKLRLPRDIDDPVPYLRRAWLLLRYVHPPIGAVYPPFSGRDEAGRPLVTVPPLDPDEWLRTSFHVNQGTQAPFKDVEDTGKIFQPAKTAMAYWFPSSSYLVIRSTHLRWDGPGICRATNTFMLGLVSVMRLGLDVDLNCYTTDVKQPSLHPGLDYMLRFPPQGTPVPPHVERAVDQLMNYWHDGLYSLSIPIREGSDNAAPANTQHVDTIFDEDVLRAILKGCRRLGISVSAAVHASIVRVWASFPQQHPKARNMLITLIANLRSLLDPKWVTPDYGLSVCCFFVPFCLTGGFEELNQRMGAVYSRDLSALPLDPVRGPVSFAEILPHYEARETAFLDTLPIAGCPPFRVPNLSSLGVLEKWLAPRYGQEGRDPICEIEDLHIVNATSDPTPEFQLWIFRGTMRMYVYYNDAYYTEDFMSAIMSMVRDNLLEELGLSTKKLPEGSDPKNL
ncbi:hypothetical protein DL767_001417 [Monosporascus sp. MG133]|nr:hypothetical protein DL767_001417 [Monosporascus sp. MG133]